MKGKSDQGGWASSQAIERGRIAVASASSVTIAAPAAALQAVQPRRDIGADQAIAVPDRGQHLLDHRGVAAARRQDEDAILVVLDRAITGRPRRPALPSSMATAPP